MTQEKKGINTDSNAYTIVYAAVMVVIVALLLALTSSLLKQRQDDNIALDKKKQILGSLNVDIKGKDAAALYDTYVTAAQILKTDGTEVSQDRDEAFAIDVAKENSKAEAERSLPVFIAEIDGQKKYVLPLRGAGLWGPIWGYVALNADKRTIFGVNFSHESETPGLGGEITKSFFTERFAGKTLYAESPELAIDIVKSNATGQQVDAISGATFTSNGVEDMLTTSLKQYAKFMNSDSPCCKQNGEEQPCCKQATENATCCKADSAATCCEQAEIQAEN